MSSKLHIVSTLCSFQTIDPLYVADDDFVTSKTDFPQPDFKYVTRFGVNLWCSRSWSVVFNCQALKNHGPQTRHVGA